MPIGAWSSLPVERLGCRSVRVLVVHVRRVVVCMHDSLVGVPMRVLTGHGRIVCVIVMAIIMSMRMFVFSRIVSMLMPVLLGNVQVHSESETSCRNQGQ